jgi:ABC-2 type transport system ATP-binding protein
VTQQPGGCTVALPADDDGAVVPDLVRDLVGLGVRVHAVEPMRVSLEERLLGILRAGDQGPNGAADPSGTAS